MPKAQIKALNRLGKRKRKGHKLSSVKIYNVSQEKRRRWA